MSVYAHENEVRSDKVRSLHRWWLDRCRHDIPDRADVDPIDLVRLLPNIMLTEVEHEPFRIRYRLVGTKIVEATGFNFVNQYLDELVPIWEDEPWVDDYRISLQARKPVFGASTIELKLGVRYSYEFALFPLTKGAKSVDQFIALEDYFEYAFVGSVLEPWRRYAPVVASTSTG